MFARPSQLCVRLTENGGLLVGAFRDFSTAAAAAAAARAALTCASASTCCCKRINCIRAVSLWVKHGGFILLSSELFSDLFGSENLVMLLVYLIKLVTRASQ